MSGDDNNSNNLHMHTSPEDPVSAAIENAPNPVHLALESAVHAAAADDTGHSTVTVQHSVRTQRKSMKKRARAKSNAMNIEIAEEIGTAADYTLTADEPRRKTLRSKPQSEPRSESPTHDYVKMEDENRTVLGQDAPGTWQKGTGRFNATRESAAVPNARPFSIGVYTRAITG